MHTFSIRSLFFTLTVLAVALATPLRAAVATAQLTTLLTTGLLAGLKPILDKGKPEGPWKAHLEATVPLEKGDWKVDLDLREGAFTLQKPAVQVGGFTGHASITPATLGFQGGKVHWGERVLEWSLQTNAHSAAKKRETRIAVSGAFEAARLREAIPELALPAFVREPSTQPLSSPPRSTLIQRSVRATAASAVPLGKVPSTTVDTPAPAWTKASSAVTSGTRMRKNHPTAASRSSAAEATPSFRVFTFKRDSRGCALSQEHRRISRFGGTLSRVV
jgi:hypothetical protein